MIITKGAMTASAGQKMTTLFNLLLGNNPLRQVIYNPCTGGCYDGLEENYVNLNQGAESTVSYLMAKLTIEKKILDITAIKLSEESFLKTYRQNLFA